MNRWSIKLGLWSAVLCAATFIVFTLCFLAIVAINPLYIWTNFEDWVRYNSVNNQSFKYLAQMMMLFFGILFVVLLNSIHDYTQDGKKILARISLSFAIIFAAMTGMHYFVQISVVRLNLAQGQLQGLEQFIQGNPTSAMAGINMLGWTVFFGLSSLFIAPVFSGGRLERLIRYSFLANGVIVLLGGVGYIFDITILVFVLMNLGMGAAVILFTLALALLFRRLAKQDAQLANPA